MSKQTGMTALELSEALEDCILSRPVIVRVWHGEFLKRYVVDGITEYPDGIELSISEETP